MDVNATESQTVSHRHPWLHRLLWLTCLVSLLGVGVLSYQHVSYKNSIYASAKADLRQLTADAAARIDAVLRQAMNSAETLANGLTEGGIDRDHMLHRLREMLVANPYAYGGSISFVPYGYTPDVRLYSAYYSKSGRDGALEFLQLADVYDYTAPEYDWYVQAMDKGNRWSEPYWDEAGKTYMITYSALFYRVHPDSGEKTANGVVTIDISMAQIRDIIESLNIGPSGFGALTTRDGNYLYHPNYEYVQTRQNIRDVARQKNDADRLVIADRAARGEGGVIDHVSTTTGEASWLIFATVPTSGWSLQNTFIKSDLDINVDTLRQQILWIIISAILFCSTLAALLLKASFGSPFRVWLLTAIVSVLLIVGISIIWDLALTYHPSIHSSGVKVSDKATLQAVMNSYRQSSESKHLDPPLYVPTGVYIDAIEFNNANDVLVTGRLWQTYGDDYPQELAKGLQIGRAKSVKMEELGRYPVAGGEVLQWAFQAILRVPVDYSRYPLEVEHLDMQLLPLAKTQNVVLVPDLDAYTLTTATLLPGLDQGAFLPGWKLNEAYFVLRALQKNTDFGIEQAFEREVMPTLYYEIGVKRVFIDAFISNLTPLIVVSIVLFAVALLSKHVEVGRLMSICVAVFFVVVFSHLDIRKSISAGEIFYLEYFFFVIYFVIILVPMDAFRLALGMRSPFFEYQNGLLAKAIY
jgi:hypothetical protein